MGHYNGQSAKLQVIFHRYIEKHLSMSAPNISDKKGAPFSTIQQEKSPFCSLLKHTTETTTVVVVKSDGMDLEEKKCVLWKAAQT